MDDLLLNELSQKLKIAPLNILREEAEMVILSNIAEAPFSKNIIFYGGTALRLAYGCPRFSEDLDFLMVHTVKEAELRNALLKSTVQEPGLTLEDLKDKRYTLFALLKLRSPSLKHALNIKIEISRRKNDENWIDAVLNVFSFFILPSFFNGSRTQLSHKAY